VRLPLRLRLGVLFTAGFGVLLCAAGFALHQWLVHGYRAEFDQSLEASADGFAALHRQEMESFGDPWAAAEHALQELLYPDRFFMVWREGSDPLVSRGLGESAAPDAFLRPPGGEGPWNVSAGGSPYRVAERTLAPGILGYVVHTRAPLEERIDSLTATLWIGLPLVLVLGGVLGALGSRSALRPVVGVAGSAREVARAVASGADRFERLDEPEGGDEVAVLTASFNELVDRLGPALRRERALVEHQRTFLATAAHEMRMPLTILRSEAEVALEGGDDDAERLRRALRRVAEESDGMGELVADLLLLARADSAGPELHPERVFLDDLASRALHRLRSHPEARGRPLRLGDFESAPASVDPTLTERTLTVLLHNALVHAAPSALEVSAGCTGGEAWVSVRDWGPGIPEEARAEIFERFVRLDPATPGTGLGLPIAAWIAEVHGGRLELECPEGGGARFTLVVPAADRRDHLTPASPPANRRPRSHSR
jgi:signal transduction histidine kinase